MKKTIYLSVFSSLISLFSLAQETVSEHYTAHNKGKFYVYWGGNRETFSNSDITFKGNDYNFTIYDVPAQDKPKGWHIDYINPLRMTIPQTNFRLGYFINDHYNISLGLDHMKYVMYQNKVVNYTGNYPNRGVYGEDKNELGQPLGSNQVNLTEDFLTFEHTDGLNYVNAEISRVDDLTKYIAPTLNTDKVQLNLTEGIGAGILLPKTNTKLFHKERYDEFHLAGYGIAAKAGLNLTFLKHFFIQGEFKGGYINMPDIRTSYDSSDRASQHFWFLQRIIAFGVTYKL
ncbi:hypothetical protein V8245_10550 [Flavobacterium columnare]|uniref:hypothetical protein n=1 Tax=Flavobacterium columnare TaxID=996 RepID=UPI003C2DBC43